MKGLDLLEIQEQIFKCADATLLIYYHANFLYLLPKFNLRRIPYKIKKDCVVVGGEGRVVLPLVESKQEAYQLLVREANYGTLTNVPHYYARHFKRMGKIYKVSKRMWGSRDFVFSTKQIIEMRGKKLASARNSINKLAKRIEVVKFEDYPNKQEFIDVNNLWVSRKKEAKVHVGRQNDVTYLLNNYEKIKKHLPSFEAIGLRDIEVGKIVAISLAVKSSNKYWCNAFRLADNSYSSIGNFAFREIAKFYQDIPYEIDGDGNGVGSNLYNWKKRYLTDDVQLLQLDAYGVSRVK